MVWSLFQKLTCLAMAAKQRAPVALALNNICEEKQSFSLLRIISGPHALALLDQAVVSGASFLTTVMVGRWAVSSQLGIYSIGVSLLVSGVTFQNSLISLPYTIHRQQPLGTAEEDAGSALMHTGLVSALAILVLVASAVGLSAYGAGPEFVTMSWALAGVAPFVLFREFSRQFAFAHLQLMQPLAVDAAAAAIQISLLSWLGWTGRMSTVTALGAIGAGCAVPTIVWLFLTARDFAIRGRQTLAALKKNWSLGKWLLASQLTEQVRTYITYWASMAIVGASATGAYAACMSIALFANPFILGVGNILTPRLVLAWKNGGGKGLRAQAIRDSLLLGAVMSIFCIAVLLGGENLIHFLYHNKEYEGQGHLVVVLAVALSASVVSNPASNALASMQRPRAILFVSSIGAAITVVMVCSLMVAGGMLWAAYGLLIGNTAGSIGRWLAFLAVVRQSYGASAALARC
jgi:O-antigen/teichoic acid export membrane protein